MTFFVRTAKCTHFDYKRKEEIFEDLKVEPVDGKLRGYKSNWLRHMTRMQKGNAELWAKWTKTT